MNSERKAYVTITCVVADSALLDKVANYAEICQQAWETIFGADAPMCFNIDVGDSNTAD